MSHNLPSGFVFLSDIDPSIIENVRYATTENFLGRQVSGYTSNKIICTQEAAQHLNQVHHYFTERGYNLVVYDGYRPQRAVDEFKYWGRDHQDIRSKPHYYPTLSKEDLFTLGYLADKGSMHSRGSTFDLTLIKNDKSLKPIVPTRRVLLNGEEIPFLDDNTVDMGSSFDLFHKASHHDSPLVSATHNEMRDLLRAGMKQFGFAEYPEEWWHYCLKDEPHPETYFDFVVENK